MKLNNFSINIIYNLMFSHLNDSNFSSFSFFFFLAWGRNRRGKGKGSRIRKVWCQGMQPTAMKCWTFHHHSSEGQDSHRFTNLEFVHFVSNIIFIVPRRIRWNMISAIIPFFPHILKAILPVGTLLYNVRLFP